MTADVKIREAVPADYAAVAGLLNRAYRAIGAVILETPTSIGKRAQAGLLVVTEAGGRILGTVTVAPVNSHPLGLPQGREMEFTRFAVDPRQQGQGVGRALLTAVVNACAAQGVETIVGQSLDTMQTAHRLYQGFGAIRQISAEDITHDGTPVHYYRLTLKTSTSSPEATNAA